MASWRQPRGNSRRRLFYGDIVAGDDVLGRNVERFQAHVDAIQGLNGPEHQFIRPPFAWARAAQAQDDSALPFL